MSKRKIRSFPRNSACWRCGDKHEVQNTLGQQSPNPGDFSVCFNCGAIARFADDLQLRKLSPEEAREIPNEVIKMSVDVALRGRIRHAN